MRDGFNGIEGLKAREPVGVVATIGKKGPRGNPVERDRFYLVEPYMNNDGIRPAHPKFVGFNTADPRYRTQLTGNIVHAAVGEAFEHKLSAQVLGGRWPAHPNKRPACVGDGREALRYYGENGNPDDFRRIPCPNEACEFRQGNNRGCKPFMRLLFKLRWSKPGMPELLCKLTSKSWNSVSAALGYFQYVEDQARQLGLEPHEYSLFGLPISIGLAEKTQPSKRRRFPVLSFTHEGDLLEFLHTQKVMRDQLLTKSRPYAAITDDGQQDPGEIYRDHMTVTPGKPAEVIDVEQAPTSQQDDLPWSGR
jgi:hypothetical protein